MRSRWGFREHELGVTQSAPRPHLPASTVTGASHHRRAGGHVIQLHAQKKTDAMIGFCEQVVLAVAR